MKVNLGNPQIKIGRTKINQMLGLKNKLICKSCKIDEVSLTTHHFTSTYGT